MKYIRHKNYDLKEKVKYNWKSNAMRMDSLFLSDITEPIFCYWTWDRGPSQLYKGITLIVSGVMIGNVNSEVDS